MYLGEIVEIGPCREVIGNPHDIFQLAFIAASPIGHRSAAFVDEVIFGRTEARYPSRKLRLLVFRFNPQEAVANVLALGVFGNQFELLLERQWGLPFFGFAHQVVRVRPDRPTDFHKLRNIQAPLSEFELRYERLPLPNSLTKFDLRDIGGFSRGHKAVDHSPINDCVK